MMRHLILASCLLVTDVLGWSYDRCNATEGPVNGWGLISGSSCGTAASPQMEGTPINLCAATRFPGGAVPQIVTRGYNVPTNFSIVNEGKTVQINVLGPNVPNLTAGNLAFVVNRSSANVTATWRLAQLHLHWGRTSSEGSEHFLQGKAYPLEAHFVHYNAAYGNNLSAALVAASQGKKDVLLVVGIFFNITTTGTDVAFVRNIANRIPSTPKAVQYMPANMLPSQLMNAASGHFYSYRGSLTTPGCNEIVTWIVMQKPVPITAASMNKFWKAPKDSTELQSKYGNYRPLQPMNGRPLYSSSGATAACAAKVTQPKFECCYTVE